MLWPNPPSWKVANRFPISCDRDESSLYKGFERRYIAPISCNREHCSIEQQSQIFPFLSYILLDVFNFYVKIGNKSDKSVQRGIFLIFFKIFHISYLFWFKFVALFQTDFNTYITISAAIHYFICWIFLALSFVNLFKFFNRKKTKN